MAGVRVVGFDFDGTLSRADVQDYAAELIALGVELHIVTSREPENGIDFIDNSDLWDIVNQLAIPKKNVHFLSYQLKAHFYAERPEFTFHLDDDEVELKAIYKNTYIRTVNVNKDNFMETCDKMLKI